MSWVTRAVGAHLGDADVLEWLRRFRWPDGQVRCPHCGSDQVRAYLSSSHRRVVSTYRCRSCRRRFNDKTGTVFAQTRLPMTRWLTAAWLIELGAGRRSLQRYLRVDRATARRIWNGLTRDTRLRQAMARSLEEFLT
ncbi:MAG: transposase [Acidobacteria bacterium]|nr:transposase [Acidobacteriota bacterium]MDW7984414.1 transposase [Acidobacteriota bacterium]